MSRIILFILLLAVTAVCTEKDTAGSIYFAGMVPIGGISQYIEVKGSTSDLPLLLYLHGGPGSSDLPEYNKIGRDLEKYFIVAHWDQRGTGLSYSRDIPPESMSFEQYLKDAGEVIDYLLTKYNRDRLVLYGVSWGGAFGLMCADRYPDKLHAFITAVPMFNFQDCLAGGHSFSLSNALASHRRKAIRQLTDIPFPLEPQTKEGWDDFISIKKWTGKFGGFYLGRESLTFKIRYYGIRGLSRLMKGTEFCHRHMGEELAELALEKDILTLKVPFFLLLGRYDRNVPSITAEKYYDKLTAPYKKLIWFEKSAHGPSMEEPENFTSTMAEIWQILNSEKM